MLFRGRPGAWQSQKRKGMESLARKKERLINFSCGLFSLRSSELAHAMVSRHCSHSIASVCRRRQREPLIGHDVPSF
jgi:hypothetical protein